MNTHKDHLSRAYELNKTKETQEFYSDWAVTYDAEVLENGYATPLRCAKALAGFTPEQDLSILDIGCGTGLSGEMLAKTGFTRIDGCDVNPEMLEIAKKRGVYDDTWQENIRKPLDFETGRYDAITAIGVIGVGAAPVNLLYTLFSRLDSGGLAVLSLNDHSLQDPSYEAALSNHLDCGQYQLLFKEYGDHLPGQDMKSTVYVVRKQ